MHLALADEENISHPNGAKKNGFDLPIYICGRWSDLYFVYVVLLK